MYKLSKQCVIKDGVHIPLDPANRRYQQFLDDINDGVVVEGEDVIEPSYKELREAEYPSMADQLDMQYWDNVNGTTVWQDTIQAIKDKYPTTITGGVTVAPVPQEILDAAAEKLFNEQLVKYKAAVARLSKVELSVGQEEVRVMQATGGQTFNEETNEFEDNVAEVIVQPRIEPVPATITEYVDSGDPELPPTETVVPNPVVVRDEAERAAAQAVIDATPQAVKDAA